MGTQGIKVIRDRGVYYVWHRSHDVRPRGLGLEMHRMVPANPRVFGLWRSRLRKKLVALQHAYYAKAGSGASSPGYRVELDNESVSIGETWVYEPYDYVYELDLDNKVFLFNQYPMYHLDKLPPEDIFGEVYGEDNCWKIIQARHFYEGIPEEYRFKLSRLKGPEVKPKEVKTYKKFHAETVTEPRNIILPPPSPELSRADSLSVHLLAGYVDLYRREMGVVIYHDLALTSDTWSDDHWYGQEVAWLFVALSLFPLYIVGHAHRLLDTAWKEFFSRVSRPEFWFIRKHICVTLGTCLLDEKNTEYHISRLVDKITRTVWAPAVTYGVVFSLFHCVVIRVDKAAEGRFSRTEVLEFLPDSPTLLLGEQRTTLGMEALIRLRSAPGEDDLEVFHAWLSTRWFDLREATRRYWEARDLERGVIRVPVKKKIHKSRPRPPGPQLPIELLMMIADIFEDPEDLFNFALLSKLHMAAAIPRLWSPQVWGEGCPGRVLDGHILEAHIGDASSKTFQIRHKGRPAFLKLADRGAMYRLRNKRTSLAMMDGDETMPQAQFYLKPACRHRDLRPCYRLKPSHPELGFYTWWGPEIVKELRASLEERIVRNGGALPADLEDYRRAIEGPDFAENENGEPNPKEAEDV